MKFLSVVAEEILIQNILTKYGTWLNILCQAWRNADVIICHRYKLIASLNWCCQLLPCSDSEKSGLLMTNLWSFTVAATKNVQSNHIYVSVGIVGLSHVWARQCNNTPNLQNGCVFAWFHVPMVLNADTINIFHYRTRLSSPSKQDSNWQH